MKSFFASLFGSVVKLVRSKLPPLTNPALSPEQFRKMLAEAMSEPETRRLLLPMMASLFPVQGGMACPTLIGPGSSTANRLLKWNTTNGCDPVDSAVTESGGNVGIGTPNPGSTIDVADGTSAKITVEKTGSPANSGYVYNDGNFHIESSSSSPLWLNHDTTLNVLLAYGGGKVGIGTDNPVTTLDVSGTIRAVYSASAPYGTYLIPTGGAANSYRFGLGNNLYFDGTNWKTKGDGANNGGSGILTDIGNGALAFFTLPTTGATDQVISNSNFNNNEKMRITGTGNVGIGTTDPSNKLHVEGNVQIGTPTAVRADMKALLFGRTATKQSRDDTAHGPEMITAAAQNAGADDFRVVLWAGVQSHDNAMFLISTNGMLEWGPGTTDQEFRLERNIAHQLSLIDATLVLAKPNENNPTIALKYNGTNGGEIHLGPGGSNVLDTLISRPSTSVLNIGSVTGPAVLAVDGVNSRVGVGITSPNFVLHTSGAAVALGAPSSAPTDGNLNNSNISFWIDEGASPPKLKMRVKLSDGTPKTATIAFD